jgi:nitronate monooxygenase
MWNKTKVSEILAIEYPILQGPFGGNLSSVELVKTVSDAGRLGGYGAYTLSPQEIVDVNKKIRTATNKPYNINLWVSDTDAAEGIVTDELLNETQQLFKPYFDEFEIPLPEKPSHDLLPILS